MRDGLPTIEDLEARARKLRRSARIIYALAAAGIMLAIVQIVLVVLQWRSH